jgi:hypothetical protein
VTRQRDEQGFALVITLWFLALLAFVAVVIEGWIASSLNRANALQQRTGASAALIGAADRVIFDMVVAGRSPRGLELAPPSPVANAGAATPAGTNVRWPPESPHLALDGRPYRVGSAVVQLQDEGGLYDLSNPKLASMEKLLGGYGVSLPDADRLTAALVAYAKKPTDLRGAEDTDSGYGRSGLLLPRYARLLTPWELYRVLGWAGRPALWRGPDALPDLVTTGPAGGLAVNAASAKVLMIEAGIDEGEAARLLAARTQTAIANTSDLPGSPTGFLELLDRPLEVLPSRTIRLKLTAASDPLEHILSIRLTPQAQAPYRIDYAAALPQSAAARAAAAASSLVPPLPTPPPPEAAR